MELYLKTKVQPFSKVDEFVKAEGSINADNEIHFNDAGIASSWIVVQQGSLSITATVGGTEGTHTE